MPANSLFHPGGQFFSSKWRWYLSEGCVETIFRRPNKNAQRFWDSGTPGPQKFANAQNEALAESWLLWRLRSFVSIPSPLNVRPTIAAMSCCIQCRMLMQIKLDVDIPSPQSTAWRWRSCYCRLGMVVVRHEKYHLSPMKVRTNDALDLINATFGSMPWVAVDDFRIFQMIVGQEDPF